MAKLGIGCTAACNHIAPGCGWSHETMAAEDRGEVHTDDCGFMRCTSGRPGVRCRVGTTEKNAAKRAAKRGK